MATLESNDEEEENDNDLTVLMKMRMMSEQRGMMRLMNKGDNYRIHEMMG